MIYTYTGCCGTRTWERSCRLAEYEESPDFRCPRCGKKLDRVITAPRFLNNTKPFEAFVSPVDGTVITSEHALREHNKRNNVVNIHDGYDERSVDNFVNRDYQKPLDEERAKDLKEDMAIALQKLDQGYIPQVANEGDAP